VSPRLLWGDPRPRGPSRRIPPGEPVNVLCALTNFETFDALAGTARGPKDVTTLVDWLARAALGLGSK
jgi:hypothetical protein